MWTRTLSGFGDNIFLSKLLDLDFVVNFLLTPKTLKKIIFDVLPLLSVWKPAAILIQLLGVAV